MSRGARGYCGRFAPSPTGPLHAGSLLAAVASYLDARAQGGRWLVRIDDIDTLRTVPGASDRILAMLEALALHWDGEVVYQSGRTPAYEAAFAALKQLGVVYECSCSRREIARITGPAAPGSELRYPGTCRAGPRRPASEHAWRLRVPTGQVEFEDRCQGPQAFDVAATVGDFIVKRRDGPFAYQLAVVVDDAEAGVDHVVRGRDLLDNTPRQVLLYRALGLPEPQYAHVPVLVDRSGRKLSKSTQATAVDPRDPSAALFRSLARLGQAPPVELRNASPAAILEWGVAHWQLAGVAGREEVRLQEP
ncbi:MAG TPA: tRNA glutamyl-Q(34) synthetase GluQRS [Steroidobacteraceae bacterium]|nr:tRNA glutamyl-Q(34) synthetase GluQRS [Steroidobacteraceae bacterium]